MTSGAADSSQLLLLEYETLKTEQIARIGMRDGLIYASIASAATAIGFSLGNDDIPVSVVLAVPVAAFALGWTYLANDRKITEIGRYLREVAALEFGPGSLGWEIRHVQGKDRKRLKGIQLLVDVLVFPGSGASALIAFFAVEDDFGIWTLAAVLGGVVLLLILACEMVRFAVGALGIDIDL